MTISTLELLLRPARDRGHVVLLPQVGGTGSDDFARALLETVADARRRLLPAPGPEASASTQRTWHHEAWVAMAAAERDAVALVTGPTAGYFAPLLGDSARTLVLVHGPLSAVRHTGAAIPKKRVLEALGESGPDE